MKQKRMSVQSNRFGFMTYAFSLISDDRTSEESKSHGRPYGMDLRILNGGAISPCHPFSESF